MPISTGAASCSIEHFGVHRGMHQFLLPAFPGLRIQPRNLLPAGMEITPYNHHAKAPSFPEALVLNQDYRVRIEPSLLSNQILRRGDYDDYARRSGVNISVGTGDLSGSQWEGITGQPRWAAADNCDSRADRDYAERASPSINPQLGLHRKRFAGSWWTRSGLLKQHLANFLRVHRCVEHFCVTLASFSVDSLGTP